MWIDKIHVLRLLTCLNDSLKPHVDTTIDFMNIDYKINPRPNFISKLGEIDIVSSKLVLKNV